MKKSFKTFSKFTSILICLFVLTKCQTEEITIDNHKHSSEFKKETGSFAKFNLREYTTNLKIFNKTKKTGERLNRATEQDGFYFTIDTTSILKMSNGVTESYTIKVHNNQTPENSFQNLIIAKYKNNAPKAYLYTYFPDQEYKNRILNDFDTDFTGTATFEQLDITKINYQARCENMTVRLCSYKYVHIAGSGCANTYIGTIRVCNLDPLYSGSGTANPNPNSPNGSDNPPADGPTTSGGGIVTSNPQAYLGVPTDILPNITDLVGASVSAKFIFLMQALELNLIQSTWVGTNDDRINTVFNYLENNNNSQGRTFLKELIDSLLEMNYATAQEILEVAKITMYAKTNNYFNQNLDNIFFTNIDNDSSVNFIDPYTIIQATQLFLKHCAILKSENPTWTQTHIFAQAWLDTTQLMLDIVGLAPGFGEIADIANGIIYTITGQSTNALLSFAAAIPIGGWYASGIKFAKRADGLQFLVVGTNNLIHFGAANSKKFRAACGLIAGDLARQAHHIIPRGSALLNHPVVQRAAREASNQGFHIDSALNGIAVATWRNQPNHTNYNNRIYAKLQIFISANPNATPLQCYDELIDIIQDAKTAIINNPNTHLNDLIF